MLEKNRTYILERPTHINTTFIYIDPYLDVNKFLDQIASNALDSLAKISNLVFIFNKPMQNDIDFECMSTLYRACGYIVSDHPYRTQSLYYALTYFRTLYERMVGFIVVDLYDIRKLDIEKIQSTLNNGQLTASIFKSKRVEVDKLKTIFINNPENKQSFWDRINGKLKLGQTSGMYSRFEITGKTSFIYLRQLFVDEMKQFLKEDYCPPFYLESFYTRDPGEFFASIAERLPEKVKVLDLAIEEL